jgi:hypothetical protein
VLVIAGTAATCEQVGGRARCILRGATAILNEGKAEDVSIKMFLISNNLYSIDSNLLHIEQLNFAVSASYPHYVYFIPRPPPTNPPPPPPLPYRRSYAPFRRRSISLTPSPPVTRPCPESERNTHGGRERERDVLRDGGSEEVREGAQDGGGRLCHVEL